MDNLKMHSLDGVQRNIDLIGKLFPNVITEVKRNGKVEHAIDFDVLRQELSDSIVEGREERYQFTWPDKKRRCWRPMRPLRQRCVRWQLTVWAKMAHPAVLTVKTSTLRAIIWKC